MNNHNLLNQPSHPLSKDEETSDRAQETPSIVEEQSALSALEDSAVNMVGANPMAASTEGDAPFDQFNDSAVAFEDDVEPLAQQQVETPIYSELETLVGDNLQSAHESNVSDLAEQTIDDAPEIVESLPVPELVETLTDAPETSVIESDAAAGVFDGMEASNLDEARIIEEGQPLDPQTMFAPVDDANAPEQQMTSFEEFQDDVVTAQTTYPNEISAELPEQPQVVVAFEPPNVEVLAPPQGEQSDPATEQNDAEHPANAEVQSVNSEPVFVSEPPEEIAHESELEQSLSEDLSAAVEVESVDGAVSVPVDASAEVDEQNNDVLEQVAPPPVPELDLAAQSAVIEEESVPELAEPLLAQTLVAKAEDEPDFLPDPELDRVDEQADVEETSTDSSDVQVAEGSAFESVMPTKTSDVAINVKDLCLEYPLDGFDNRKSLKTLMFTAFGHKEKRATNKAVLALQDISFSIGHGERVGLIGHNGAGKSTLLRVLAGIYPIDKGDVSITGRISTLLELTTGFEFEATGRENVHYRGISMGRSPQEIKEAEADIVAFADLGDFIDLPVRTYSAGMTVRLAFAISTHFMPDVLLIDEIFGAGDAAFQKRAQERMMKIVAESGIMVIAIHDLALIRKVCSRVIWLNQGRVFLDGSPDWIVPEYEVFVRNSMNEETPDS